MGDFSLTFQVRIRRPVSYVNIGFADVGWYRSVDLVARDHWNIIWMGKMPETHGRIPDSLIISSRPHEEEKDDGGNLSRRNFRRWAHWSWGNFPVTGQERREARDRRTDTRDRTTFLQQNIATDPH